MRHFGVDKICEVRKKLGLTQKDLAKLSGVSQSMIAKIESELVDPSYSKVIAIMDALETESSKRENRKRAMHIMTKSILSAKPCEKLDKIINSMRNKAISQLPVFESGKPIGSISENMFVEWMQKYGSGLSNISVGEVMAESFPTVPHNSDIDVITHLLKFYKAVLVEKDGKVSGIITKADLIKAMND